LLYPSTLDLQLKITECEKRYFGQGLPTVFKITDGTDSELDKLLEQNGYAVLSPTYLMTADMNGGSKVSDDCLITKNIDKKWLDTYFFLSKYTDAKRISIATQVFTNIKVDVICGTLLKNNEIVACGLCVIELGYAGLFSVVVDEAQRGKGYGKEICLSLLSASQSHGAHTAYLQVVQDNSTAVNLYTKLGYKAIYSYWYRVKKGEA
jgi:ribosomal protein S18 acetylase RimI-like enzyme